MVDANILQFVLVCGMAFLASVLSGLSGYGAGLILPVFIATLVGIENVIPVMSVVVLLNNGGRVVAFWRSIDWNHVRHILAFGLPACAAGAYGYTLLGSQWISFLLGVFLLVSIPLRKVLTRFRFQFSNAGERGAGALFGFINGGMTGTGIFLISILLSAGIEGTVLIATDAVVSAVMGAVKIVLFSSFSMLNLELAVTGLLIGLCTLPGAFVARRLMNYIPAWIHVRMMELVIFLGATVLIWRAFP